MRYKLDRVNCGFITQRELLAWSSDLEALKEFADDELVDSNTHKWGGQWYRPVNEPDNVYRSWKSFGGHHGGFYRISPVMEMSNIYKDHYKNYWSEEGRIVRIYIYEMCKGLPAHYCIGRHREGCVQKALDGTWRGYLNGNLVAYGADHEINRVLIRTHKKYLKMDSR